MMRMAMKSRNEIRNMPTVSRANDVRYCSWARTRMRASRTYSAAVSTSSSTLDHQTAHAEREHPPRRRDQSCSPCQLDRERTDDLEAADAADEDIDGDLDDRRKRCQRRDRAEPRGKEAD